jgi:putative hydrolase of the HAD superfamily
MGTLVHLEPPAPRLQRELARRFGLSLSAREAEHAMAAEIAYYREHMHAAADAVGVNALRRAAAEALRLGLPEDRRRPDISTGALVDALLGALHFTAYPEAVAALIGARRRGLRLVAVSNWDSSLPDVLDRVGIGAHLDGVITSARAGAAKPDPAIFRAGLALAGVDAAEALHVGDSLNDDVAGAHAAGIAAVWLNRRGAGAETGVPTIASLAELAHLA